MLSAAIVAVGGALYLINYGMGQPNYQVFQGEPVEFRVLPEIVEKGLTLHRRRSPIQIGLLILVATPILRVAFSGYLFARQGDRMYVVITRISWADFLNGICVFALTSLVLGAWVDQEESARVVTKIAGVAALLTIFTDTFFF